MTTPQQIAAAEIAEWISQAPGRKFNPDQAFGVQCVDLADQYAQDIFGVSWRQTLGAVPGARDLMRSASEAYFTKVWNNPDDPNLIPPDGALIIWGGTAGRSPNSNPWGHVAVNIKASTSGVKVVQQDGYAAPLKWVHTGPGPGDGAYFSDKPAHVADLGYDNPGTGMVSGWLIPRPEKVKNTGALSRGFGPKTPDPLVNPTATITPNGIMHGIDVSSHQKGIRIQSVPADFVIVKVTGGTEYVNPEAREQVTAARAAGKLVGLYHYAAEYDRKAPAREEAEHFLRHAMPLTNENTNLILDWENPAIIGGDGNVWARDWLDYVAAETGARPWLYGYLSAIEKQTWATVSKKYPLWLAWYGNDNPFHGYATDFTPPFKVPHGFKLLAWQYSQFGRLPGHDGNLDLNVFFGTGDTWKAYAQGKTPAVTNPGKVTPQSSGSNTNVAPKPRIHVVKPGESLSGLAAQYGTTIAAIRALNSFIRDPNYLAVGDRIQLPPVTPPEKPKVHVVKPGEALSGIAALYGTTVGALIAANTFIKDPNYLAVGDRVKIPARAEAHFHTVAPGQSLSWIASQYGTTVDALRAANSFIKDPNYLAVGDRVRIP